MEYLNDFIDFLKGKKSYIVGAVALAYGLLTGNGDAVIQGIGLMTLRAGIAKMGGN